MGIYMYSIRAKTHKVVLENGMEVQANELRFLYNGGSFFTPRKSDLLLQARAEKFWEGKPLPKYVVQVGEKGPEPGDRLYTWTGKGPFWVDTDSFPGDYEAEILVVEKNRLRAGAHVCKPFADCKNLETGEPLCVCGNAVGPAADAEKIGEEK